MKTQPTFFPPRALGVVTVVLFLMMSGCQDVKTVPEPPEVPDTPEVIPPETTQAPSLWEPYDQGPELEANRDHPIARMRYKLIQSRISDKNTIFEPLSGASKALDPQRYEQLRDWVLPRSIPEIQEDIRGGLYTYEELTLFFLSRIYRYELNRDTYLNTILALNPEAIAQARRSDSLLAANPGAPRHPVFGMPVLLKDNIDTEGMPTTAGALALADHTPEDAFIVQQLKGKGAVILGKVNLSEWAYYFCSGCPVGYSAIGGQTLNPYGRRQFETGGSSSGSGTAIAAGYAIAAVGTETSGSILSPSGQNSVVGLKPTVGVLSRTGIVPISGTLDTPGPMTRFVSDTGILLDAMMGYDEQDAKSVNAQYEGQWYLPEDTSLAGLRFGVFESLLESDSLYRVAVDALRAAGAQIVPFTPPDTELEGFTQLLNGDMRQDLPQYLSARVRDTAAVTVASVADIVAFNREDSLLRAPYGQGRLEGILADTTPADSLPALRRRLQRLGMGFFEGAFKEGVHAVLSVNNQHAGLAAVARYPALGVPMGYRPDGQPANLTFIARRFQELELLRYGAGFEALGPFRQMPQGYTE